MKSILPILKILCENSAEATLNFLNQGACQIVQRIIEKPSEDGNVTDYFIEALELLSGILPKKNAQDQVNVEKAEIFKENTGMLQPIGEFVLPSVIVLYERHVNKGLRALILEIFDKILTFSASELIESYIDSNGFAIFLAELLGCKDSEAVKSALNIVSQLYDRFESHVAENFVREGVTTRIEMLRHMDYVQTLSYPKRNIVDLVRNSRPGVSNLKTFLSKTGVNDPAIIN